MIKMIIAVALIFNVLKITYAVSGVIWNKDNHTFVPLFSIPIFAAMRNDYLKSMRDLEYHNFNHSTLKVAYFQVS